MCLLTRCGACTNSKKFIIPREHLLYESLSRTGSSDPRLEGLRKERLISMKQTLEQYEASLRHLVDCSGSRFKPCWQRSNARYDFVPTNLHVNQIALTDLNGGVVSFHNVITVGAFCIGSRSHRSSGLFKMAANTALSSTSYPPSSLSITALGSQSPIAAAVCLLESRPGGKASRLLYQGSRTLAMLRGDLVGLVQRLSARDQAELLSERIRRMLMTMQCIFSDNLLNDAQIDTHIKIESGTLLQLLRELSVLDALGGSEASRALLESTADAEKRIDLLGAIQKAGDLVIACLDSAWDRGAELLWNILLEDLLSINKPNNFGDPTLTESDLIAEAERVCLTNMAVNLDNALTALAVVYDSFAYRHHACLCQALTALLTALAAAIPHWNRTRWEQVAVCGLLAHFEGLLSCYGSELGMIEDWAWAIEHLADIRIVIRPSSSLGERTGDSEAVVHPVVQKGAEYACDSTDHTFSDFPIARMTDMHECELVIPWSAWTGAPTEIQSHGRVRLRIHSVSFLVGINEQQTIAEKFDRIGVQQAVNNRGLSSLELYFERYTKHYGAPPRSPSNHDVCDLIANIRHLLTSPPRSKPVELLEFASEATQALGGLRFTSCKSAKDRTSMSLTLEQIRWLKNAEGLNESYVHSALECVRRTGLRMENLFKNTGGRKYAFNRLQLLYFPRLYRPPLGTYGLGVTP
ncbi:unnamed protein product [Dicrocoelium dendriticum]|nr:unnamed protein product [Dicrocoelium dendriticum]